jgi:hypothetical protein
MATSSLTWNRVNDVEWQAGGLAGYYSIIEHTDRPSPEGVIFHDVGYMNTEAGKLTRLGGSYSFLEARKFAEAHHANSPRKAA